MCRSRCTRSRSNSCRASPARRPDCALQRRVWQKYVSGLPHGNHHCHAEHLSRRDFGELTGKDSERERAARSGSGIQHGHHSLRLHFLELTFSLSASRTSRRAPHQGAVRRLCLF